MKCRVCGGSGAIACADRSLRLLTQRLQQGISRIGVENDGDSLVSQLQPEPGLSAAIPVLRLHVCAHLQQQGSGAAGEVQHDLALQLLPSGTTIQHLAKRGLVPHQSLMQPVPPMKFHGADLSRAFASRAKLSCRRMKCSF